MSTAPSTIPELVRQRAKVDGDSIAYTFLGDGATGIQSITWSQLDQRATDLAGLWHARGVAGKPVLLGLPSGLKFVESLFACWYAGAIAVPVSLPRHARVKHRLDRIVSDANANFMIGMPETRDLLGTSIADLEWLDPRETSPSTTIDVFSPPIALLQYTSGSTGSPRGVVVTHANLMHNSALIASACGHSPGQTIGGWLPLFHDMGLVGLLIQAAFSGARCVFMSPERFLMRPWLWLRMISDFNICSSPAPNFAYDLCVDKITPEQKSKLNLSQWRNALNGSEPVRAKTLTRFAEAFQSCGFSSAAFFSCYGLAEATLFVTGPSEKIRNLPLPESNYVSCGQPMGDSQLAIVDPDTTVTVPTGNIGEIWIASPSVAQGYWNDADTTQAVFKAQLPGDTDQTDWLRTGDLGFIADDQLFITGRIRELIIIAGRNLFPVDLEQTVESAHPSVASSATAAFSIDIESTERLIIAAELQRELLKSFKQPDTRAPDFSEIRRKISIAIISEHGITPHDILLLHPGALPRTTSGKLRRGAAKQQYLDRAFTPITISSDIPIDAASSH